MYDNTKSESELSMSRCPACDRAECEVLVDIERLPVLVCDEFATAEQARAARTGRVTLAYCHCCGFVHNASFEAEKVEFKPGYSATLSHTATFRGYIDSLVSRLIERYDLRKKSIVEIGCGDGYLLGQLCSRGANEGIGIDPTLSHSSTQPAGQGSVQLIDRYFSDEFSHLTADLVCGISVFETLPDPAAFLRTIHAMTVARPGAVVYFEVPNAAYMLERRATWSIYYEQFAHYTAQSLSRLFERCGFEILDASPCYQDGQYVYVEAAPRSVQNSAGNDQDTTDQTYPAALREFGEKFRRDVEVWRKRLQRLSNQSRKVVVWGSGGKGNTFLNVLPTEHVIHHVVDINPQRHGKYIPGSGQRIVPPEYLRIYRPDTIIITNPIYASEIRDQVRELGISCEFLTI